MIEYKKRWEKSTVIDNVTCDKCGHSLDNLDIREALIWRNTGGYISVFGDGAEITLDLCQNCVKELLGEFIHITEV